MQRLEAFGQYDLIERINVGGSGEVFRAVSRDGKRLVALKRLMPYAAADDHGATERLEGEAKLSRELDHPAITKVTDYGSVGAHHFIVYEFVVGRDLRAIQERAKRLGGVPLDIAVALAMQVASALAHVHARLGPDGKPLGIIHRDVTPSNILVSYDGGAKLSDFGIARVRGRAGRTAAGQVQGTLGYLSPEQISGGVVDARCDLYALGVCLWELATGRRLFEGEPETVLRRIASGDLPAPRLVNPRVTEELERVILKALAQSPDQRYATAEAFLDDLSALSSGSFPLADSKRVESFLRTLFPEAAAEVAASREESLNMSDDKGGSDLDVFEGLAAKKSQRAPAPGLTPPPPAPPPQRARTMMGGLGGLAPLTPPPSPPPTASGLPSLAPPPSSMPVPPPPSRAMPPPANTLPPTAGTSGMFAPPANAASSSMLAPPKPLPVPHRPSAIPPPASTATTAGLGPPMQGSLPRVSAPPPHGSSSVGPPPQALSSQGPTAALPPPPGRPTASSLPPMVPPPPHVPPPEKKKTSGKAAVDMDWDDDEESTHVYDKQRHDLKPSSRPRPPSKALMSQSGHAAPLAPPTTKALLSLPPPSAPAKLSLPAPTVPPSNDSVSVRLADEPTEVRPRYVPASGSGSRLGLILGGIAVALIAAVAVVMLLPHTGQFRIDVKLKDGTSLDKAEIYVDGQKKCDATPCVVADLPSGPKSIKVIAGTDSASTTETVEAGKDKAVLVTIDHAAAATGTGTGFKAATTTTTPVKINVDNIDKGVLPVELKDLSPGAHQVKFDAGDRYEKADAKTITVNANEMKDLGNVALKVVKGQLSLELGTTGATVLLVRSDNGKKVERKLSLPTKIDVVVSEGWKLVATKKGKSDFRQDITFDDGQAEKTIRVDLSDKDDTTTTSSPSTTASTSTSSKTDDSSAKTTDSSKADSGGNGTLNINSIPVSKAVLDGKPLGSTPKIGLSVSPGSHTVTFITADGDKKSVTVNVKAGETKTAATHF